MAAVTSTMRSSGRTWPPRARAAAPSRPARSLMLSTRSLALSRCGWAGRPAQGALADVLTPCATPPPPALPFPPCHGPGPEGEVQRYHSAHPGVGLGLARLRQERGQGHHRHAAQPGRAGDLGRGAPAGRRRVGARLLCVSAAAPRSRASRLTPSRAPTDLQYKNLRPDYLKAIWDVIDFKDVEARFEAARK